MTQPNNSRQRLLAAATAASLCLNLCLLVKILLMDKEYSLQIQQIHQELSSYKEETHREISNSVWELEEIINRQSSLISDFNYHIQPVAGGKVKLMLSAHLKSHKDGQITSFTVDGDGEGSQRILTTLSNSVLSSQVILPRYKAMTIGLAVSDQYTAKTETLLELSNVPQGLTSHLTITPSISMERNNSDASARVSGEVYLINEKGTQASRALSTHCVDLVYNGKVLHTISFEPVSHLPMAEGDEVYYANIQPYPIPVDTAGTLSLIARATDMEGFAYTCLFEEYSITEDGKFTPVSSTKSHYFTIDN